MVQVYISVDVISIDGIQGVLRKMPRDILEVSLRVDLGRSHLRFDIGAILFLRDQVFNGYVLIRHDSYVLASADDLASLDV